MFTVRLRFEMRPGVEVRRFGELFEQRALALVEHPWNDDVCDRVQVAGRTAAPGKAASGQAQLLARSRAWRDLERDGARGRRQMHGRTERRFPRSERKVEVQILPRDAVQRMRLDADVEIQVAIARTVHALAALARNAQLLTVDNPFRDAHLDLSWDAMGNALIIVFQRGEIELDLRPVKCLLEAQTHRGFVVGPRTRRTLAARRAASMTRETRKQVGEIDVLEDRLRTAESLLPVRRRPEILPRGMATQLIVGRSLLGILQRLVGLRNLLEALLGVGLLGYIGVILARELAIGFLDVLCARGAINTERSVIVLVLHLRRCKIFVRQF